MELQTIEVRYRISQNITESITIKCDCIQEEMVTIWFMLGTAVKLIVPISNLIIIREAENEN